MSAALAVVSLGSLVSVIGRSGAAANHLDPTDVDLTAARPWLRRWLLAAVMFVIALMSAPAAARADREVPPYQARCTDLAGILSRTEQRDIEARLRAYEEATGFQVAVLIVPSLDGEPIEDFSYRVAKAWRLGRKDRDDGVLITTVVAERKIRIEIGKGIEGEITDLESSQIIRERMRPLMQQGRWHGAFTSAIEAIEMKLSGRVYEPAPSRKPAKQKGGSDVVGVILSVALIGTIVWLFARARRRHHDDPVVGGGGPMFLGGFGGYGGGPYVGSDPHDSYGADTSLGDDSGGSDGGGFDSGPGGDGGDFGGGGASDDW